MEHSTVDYSGHTVWTNVGQDLASSKMCPQSLKLNPHSCTPPRKFQDSHGGENIHKNQPFFSLFLLWGNRFRKSKLLVLGDIRASRETSFLRASPCAFQHKIILFSDI